MKKPKTTRRLLEALVAQAASKRKVEEDYWVIAAVFDDPLFSGFDQIIGASGARDLVIKKATKLLNTAIQQGRLPKTVGFQVYHGDEARTFLATQKAAQERSFRAN